MYAYCPTKLASPASMSFEWVEMSVFVCPRYLSISSLILQRWDGFLFSPLWVFVCRSWKQLEHKCESEGELWGRGSAVNARRAVLLLVQFEYVFLIGLRRPRLLFSAFLKSVCMMWLCWAEEPRSNGVHLKPGEHAHYLQPKARLI